MPVQQTQSMLQLRNQAQSSALNPARSMAAGVSHSAFGMYNAHSMSQIDPNEIIQKAQTRPETSFLAEPHNPDMLIKETESIDNNTGGKESPTEE